MIDDKRLKNIKILSLVDVNTDLVEEKIREHEKRFLYKPKVPIIITPLLTKDDYLAFLKPKEYTSYKIKKDREWGEHYNIKSLTILFANNIGKIAKIAEHQIKNTYRLLKTRNFPKRAIQPMIAIVSWHLTGYKGYEVWPWGENPYEPTVELLELGYIPRRYKDTWMVGYVPKID